MKVFVKTLIICLVVCIGCLVYAFLKNESYQPNITPNNTPVSENKTTSAPEVTSKEETVKVCFMVNENTPKFVERKTRGKSLENTISLLLQGPTDEEKALGIYSEIPPNTRLLSVKEEHGNLIINLSENFAKGGGATSVMNRIRQLIKTVNNNSTQKPVYLHLNGKKVEYVGGEGVYLNQPLNEDVLGR